MAMELELGMLISKLIPYEGAEIHLVPGDPGVSRGALEVAPEQIAEAVALAPEQIQQRIAAIPANAKPALLVAAQSNVDQALLEIETREREYLSWQFKDLPRLVKRAVRVQYRHRYQGLWVTDHLLIGYEGSNGG
jgi:hypothetical protein